LTGDNSLLEARMHPRPWWNWDGSTPELKPISSHKHDSQADVDRLRSQIEKLGAHHLVFGHQPGKMKFSDGTVREPDAIMQKYDGLVFFIDCGLSRGVDAGRAGMLRIESKSKSNETTVEVEYIDGSSETLLKH
jgi:hypothetical protein